MDANPEKHSLTVYGDTGLSMGAGSLLNLKVTKFYSFPGGERGMRTVVVSSARTGSGS